MNIKEQKKALRSKVALQVSQLTEEYINCSNKRICDAVVVLPEFERAKTIFCFIGRNIEIDTMPIIEHAIKDGKTVGVPKCVGKRVMHIRTFTSLDDMELSPFGILEPKDSAPIIIPNRIDFTVMPCMTCSEDGRRLGYGGGYYDTFLENSNSFSCLICRQEIMHNDIPVEHHDKTPDMIVTEDFVKRFKA